jgi:hypothetical protein
MGTLAVNVINRPKDEIIDCGSLGMRLNMRSYDLPYLEEDVVVGFPLEGSKKLPVYQPFEGEAERIQATRSQSAGATLQSTGSKISGILSTDPPGGAAIEPETRPTGVVAKETQVKSDTTEKEV